MFQDLVGKEAAEVFNPSLTLGAVKEEGKLTARWTITRETENGAGRRHVRQMTRNTCKGVPRIFHVLTDCVRQVHRV